MLSASISGSLVAGRRRCGSGRRVESEVAVASGRSVGLLGQVRSDEANDGISVEEGADSLGAPADLFVQSLGGVVGPELGPPVLGEAGGRGGCQLGPAQGWSAMAGSVSVT